MRKKITLLGVLLLLSIIIYLFTFVASQWELIMFNLSRPERMNQLFLVFENILNRRFFQVIALMIVAILVAVTTVSFQTITGSRILTPAVIGFDSMFVMIQTTLVFFFGTIPMLYQHPWINFIISFILMSGLSILLYMSVLRKNKNNIILLLLIGMVVTTLASNYVNLLQVLMNPETFQTVQSLTSVSVVNIDVSLIWIVIPILAVVLFVLIRKNKVYDVMLLGEDMSKNLGVDYHKETYINLIMISLAVSAATALVGPLSFLGLLAVNLSIEMFKEFKHKTLFLASSLLAAIFLIFGQSIIELIGFKTTVTTLIQLIGGIYIITLIVKEHRI
jgi:iron complex transport system permease protein